MCNFHAPNNHMDENTSQLDIVQLRFHQISQSIFLFCVN